MAIPALTLLRGITLLPVLVPLCAIVLELLLWPLGAKLPTWMAEPLGVSGSALLLFGVPYAVLIGSLLLILRTASLTAHLWVAVLAPVLMALVATPAFLWLVGIRGARLWESWELYAKLCLEVGFSYVACALGLLLLGLKTDVVRRT